MAVSPIYDPKFEPPAEDNVIDISDRFAEPAEPSNVVDISDQIRQRQENERNKANQLPDATHQQLDELKKQKIEEIKAKVEGAKKNLGSETKVGPKPLPTTIEKGTGFRGRTRAAGQAVKRGGEVVAQETKLAAAEAKRLAIGFLEKNPTVWIVIGVILLIFIVIGIVIAIFAFSRQSGSSSPTYPATDVQKSQAGLLSAFAGNKLKQFTIVEGVVQSEEKRYDTITKLIQSNPGGGVIGASSADVAKVQTDLKQIEQFIKAQDKNGATLALKDAVDQEKKVESQLPFGTWVANIAKGFTDPNSPYHKDTQICHIVNIDYAATDNGIHGCGLVVSVILNQAGIPQSIVLSTIEVWNNPVYSIVIPRPSALDHNLAKNSLATLKPGDIVWWGNGGGASYGGALFDHVGIYIGNGQSVSNSSSKTEVRENPLDRSDIIFNGAKRYAP